MFGFDRGCGRSVMSVMNIMIGGRVAALMKRVKCKSVQYTLLFHCYVNGEGG